MVVRGFGTEHRRHHTASSGQSTASDKPATAISRSVSRSVDNRILTIPTPQDYTQSTRRISYLFIDRRCRGEDMKLRRCFVLLTGVFVIPGCVAPDATPSESQRVAAQAILQPLDLVDPATTCAADPRVVAGVVTAQTCVGAELFFRGTFGGNGRTCATCHRVDNNLTIDPAFISTLPSTDPLFVAEFDP